ncbi:MAG: neutral/alkaline non-lysosomal ceramidase N-terminal domain-containing protein [Bryobacterales bacterium]|nr:neutral/alkaline non-lysosomal ceramidase N-terminal domain-containing protein [Bryobacterales bacterium]
MQIRLLLFLRLAFVLSLACVTGFAAMKAGVASVKITPTELPYFLSGYAARKEPAREVAQNIFAKALAVEDAAGARFVVVSTDLVGIPGDLHADVARDVKAAYKLDPKALVLNSSHTHSGPAVRQNLDVMFNFDAEHQAKTRRYREFLRKSIVQVVGEALGNLKPATISYGVGEAGFAANRRALRMKEADPSSNPPAPVDHSVPVLEVKRPDGALAAVVFGYSCHNTTLTGEFLEVSGDYAGYAQAELERDYPGTTAMFLMLCGGDQNPNPRSRKELAEQYGQSLAAAVRSVLAKPMTAVDGTIRSSMVTHTIPLAPRSRASLEAERNHQDVFHRRRAELVLARMERGEDVHAVEYPAQAIRVGDDFLLVTMGGEVVVDYCLNIKRSLPGKRVIVAGYSNDVMSYIPTLRVLREGGYEADDSMIYYGQTGPFTENVETQVMDTVNAALKNVGIPR